MQNLQQTLNFTESDLEANRKGYISKRQRVIIINKHWVLLIPLSLLIAYLGTLGFHSIQWFFLFTIGFVPLTLTFALAEISSRKEIDKGQVIPLSGTLRLEQTQKFRRTYHWANLGDKRFYIGFNLYHALDDRDSYTFYLTSQNRILSAEKR